MANSVFRIFKRAYVFLLIICPVTMVLGQKPVVIRLDNASFEDYPQAAHVPSGWFDCGFASQTPPDVQPNGSFQVTRVAANGSTYLGMVARDNNTWEAVAQRLKTPILRDVRYSFSILLTRSEYYLSKSQATDRDVNYITPIILRVWGGSGYCSKEELLFETTPVNNLTWQKYPMKFQAKKGTHTHIMLEAFYKVPSLFPYNGNLLVDGASDIVPEPEKKPTTKPDLAVVKPKVQDNLPKPKTRDTSPVAVAKPPKNTAEPTEPTSKPDPLPVEPNQTAVGTVQKLREGQIIKIEQLQFEPNKAEIKAESFSAIDKIYAFLLENEKLVVEIGGHTNTIPSDDFCDKLSLERAQVVSKYLIQKGVDASRLQARGYGKRQPVSKENTSAAHRINQRVEIKILSVNG
jgi:outer membrane protein OmpA-like peptidoglycan-associated protein